MVHTPTHGPSSPATPRLDAFARRLLLHEADTDARSGELAGAMQSVCQRLHDHLGTLVGFYGMEVLFTRAVGLAARDLPWVGSLEPGERGACRIALPKENAGEAELSAARDGFTAVVANVLGLLANLVGEDLVIQLVHDAWPDLARDEVSGREGASDE
jgi:hypothetical protein